MADSRTEARRLWQMMNRGGQMAGGASVVPPLYSQYNPAGAYAEAGRTVPNYASDWARGMNQVTQPFGGIPEDLHSGGAPAYYKDKPFYEEQIPYFGTDPNLVRGMREGQSPTGFDYSSLPAYGDASVVPPLSYSQRRIPTEKETLDRAVTVPEGNRDAIFSKIHSAYSTGADFGYEGWEDDSGKWRSWWAHDEGVPQEYIDIYMSAPDAAKKYAYENKNDPKILQQFEEKYGFPLDVTVEIP